MKQEEIQKIKDKYKQKMDKRELNPLIKDFFDSLNRSLSK